MPARKTRSKAADTAGTTGTEADAAPALQQTSGSASNGGSGSGNSNGNGNGRGSGSSSSATALTALFPLCHPLPDPMINTELISPSDISLEQDLLLNGTNVRTWNGYLNHVLTSNRPSEKQPFFTDADPQLSSAQVALLGPLASHSNRLGLRRVTLAYERALATFPQSYPLWKDYLLHRMHYVLGQPAGGLDAFWKRQISSGKTKLDIGPTLVDGNEGEDNAHQAWDWGREDGFAGPLDGNVGHREWESLAALFERALMHLPKMPRIWLLYTTMLMHPACPPTLSYTHTRRTFDRALRTLPPSLHLRIWKSYLRWAELCGNETCLRVWRRYLRVDPSLTERYVSILERMRQTHAADQDDENQEDDVNSELNARRSLEAAKILLRLAQEAADGKYVSPEGKSPYQLLVEWLEVCEKYADEVGLEQEDDDAFGTSERVLTKDLLNPLAPAKIPVAHIVQALGLEKFPDQAGRLWTGLATYWIRRGDLDAAKYTFEKGMAKVVTVRDFTQIFDAYAETSENVIGYMMDELGATEEDDNGDEDEQAEQEATLDQRMKDFEELMERRPFLVNEVLLRRNPNDVQEWEKRVTLFGQDDSKVIETYEKAIETVNPRKATSNLSQLFINFARFHEEGGNAGKSNLDTARDVLEKATTVPFTRVNELTEVWCEWAELEIRNGNFAGALRVMARSTAAPKTAAAVKAVNFYDDSLTVQKRLFKASKIWAFYIDLEESIGSIDGSRQVYDRIIDLKIATPQIIINYALFLEEHKYFEEAFRVYERGIDAFTYPVAFEFWNIYLSKFVRRYGASKLERARDLFEQSLEKCPEKFCRPIFLMYGKLEEEHGLAKRAMNIYERATERVPSQDKFNMFVFYIAKVASNFGLAATRPVYERAIEVLPDRQTAEMCVRFAQLERKLGEIDRARALYAHASQFCDPRTDKAFWTQWNAFEIEHGSEDTFREMLRIRRSVQAQFNTDTSYIAAYASAQQRAQAANNATVPVPADPMAQAEQQAAAGAATKTNGAEAGMGGGGSRIAPAFVAAKQQAPAATPQEPARETNSEVLGGRGRGGAETGAVAAGADGEDAENDDDDDLM